ncbi:hypothetical protein NY667_24530, partial [Xanthomonas hortorum pv. hederae]|nr:hypothetical protein [Xanthomonas hortorum pv. hederae]
SARNGQTPKIQTRLSATTRHSALSGRVIQTFPKAAALLQHLSKASLFRANEMDEMQLIAMGI